MLFSMYLMIAWGATLRCGRRGDCCRDCFMKKLAKKPEGRRGRTGRTLRREGMPLSTGPRLRHRSSTASSMTANSG